MRIIDYGDAYLKMCEKLEGDAINEHSFVVSVKGNDINKEMYTEEVIDLEEYEKEKTSYHIIYHRNTLRGIIRAFKKSGLQMIFAHSHSAVDDNIELDFSDQDRKFEEKILNIAKEENYKSNILFMVINLHKYKIHFHDERDKVQYMIPYEHQLLHEPEIHVWSSGNESMLYSRSRNSAFRIDHCLAGVLKGADNNIPFAKELAIKKIVYEKLSDINTVNIVDKPDFIERKKINRLELMVSMECNLSCRYCYAQGGSYGKNMGLMTADTVRAVFHMLKVLNIEDIFCVSFFGGEPTLAADVIKETCETVKLMKQQGEINNIPIYTMVTNGTNYNDEIKRIMLDNKIRVTVSIDGPREINDKLRVYRNGNETYNDIAWNIRRMMRDGINVAALEVTYTSLHKKMGYKLQDIEEYLKKEFHIKSIFLGQCEGNPQYEIDEIDEEDLETDNISMEGAWEVKCGLNQSGDVTSNRCEAGIHNITVTPDGSIYPCHKFICMENCEMGNVDDLNINQTKMKKMQSMLIDQNKRNCEECKNCWAQILCKGCPADSFDDSVEKGKGCVQYKEKLEKSISAI